MEELQRSNFIVHHLSQHVYGEGATLIYPGLGLLGYGRLLLCGEDGGSPTRPVDGPIALEQSGEGALLHIVLDTDLSHTRLTTETITQLQPTFPGSI